MKSTPYLAAYAGTAVLLLALDLVWLGAIAKPLYQAGIGHLMKEQPNIRVALLFYALYPVGLVIFAVAPQRIAATTWAQTVTLGALFGCFAYGTYDLTNLATLKGWPVSLTLIDLTWGTVASAAAALAGRLAARWVGKA